MDDPVAVADEQKRYWQSRGITAREAWLLLTDRWVLDVDWGQVQAWMIRWWIKNADVLLRRAA